MYRGRECGARCHKRYCNFVALYGNFTEGVNSSLEFLYLYFASASITVLDNVYVPAEN